MHPTRNNPADGVRAVCAPEDPKNLRSFSLTATPEFMPPKRSGIPCCDGVVSPRASGPTLPPPWVRRSRSVSDQRPSFAAACDRRRVPAVLPGCPALGLAVLFSFRPRKRLAWSFSRTSRQAASEKAHFKWALPILLPPPPVTLPADVFLGRIGRAYDETVPRRQSA